MNTSSGNYQKFDHNTSMWFLSMAKVWDAIHLRIFFWGEMDNVLVLEIEILFWNVCSMYILPCPSQNTLN